MASRGGDDRAIATAQQMIAQRQYAEAEGVLRQALARTPNALRANEMLGLVLVAEGRDAEAVAPLEKAVGASAASIPARQALVSVLLRLNRTAPAERQLQALVRLDPRSFDEQHNLGELYLAEGRIADGIAPLEAAQALRPGDYANGYDLALAEMMVGQLPEAEAQIRRNLQIKDSAELHSLLGEIFEKQNRPLLAAGEYQRAVEISPTEDAIFAWATELLRHQNLKEAAAVFRDGTVRYGQSARMFSGLGAVESLLDQRGAAVTALLRALDLDASDERTYFFLSKIPSIPPEQADAVTARFRHYATEHPGSGRAQLFYALNLLGREAPTDGVSRSSGEAEAVLKRAVELDPKLGEAYLQLGILYQRREQHGAAAEQFEAAIACSPQLALAHYHYAQTLRTLGQNDRARGEMETFRRLKAEQTLPDTVQTFRLIEGSAQR